MFFSSSRYVIGGCVLIGALFFGGIVWAWHVRLADTAVIFLDVGQGDAILVSRGSNQVLIDGGRSGLVLAERLSEHIPFWDKSIEAVVATHPDEDHIGGFIEGLKQYDIGVFLETKATSESAAYAALQTMKQEKNLQSKEVFAGLTIRFPEGDTIEALYPYESFVNKHTKDTNMTSIVMKVTTASGKTFLLTGDLGSEQENMLDTGQIDVLKVGHHGSKHSSSQAFLEKLQIEDAVFSVGKENRYGHPAPEVVERLSALRSRIFRTDTQGTIEYRCPPAKDTPCQIIFGKR